MDGCNNTISGKMFLCMAAVLLLLCGLYPALLLLLAVMLVRTFVLYRRSAVKLRGESATLWDWFLRTQAAYRRRLANSAAARLLFGQGPAESVCKENTGMTETADAEAAAAEAAPVGADGNDKAAAAETAVETEGEPAAESAAADAETGMHEDRAAEPAAEPETCEADDGCEPYGEPGDYEDYEPYGECADEAAETPAAARRPGASMDDDWSRQLTAAVRVLLGALELCAGLLAWPVIGLIHLAVALPSLLDEGKENDAATGMKGEKA